MNWPHFHKWEHSGVNGGVISEVHSGRRRWWHFKWQIYPWSGAQALHDEDYGTGRRFDSLHCLLMAGILQIHSRNLFITEDDERTKDRGRRERERREIREDLKGTCIWKQDFFDYLAKNRLFSPWCQNHVHINICPPTFTYVIWEGQAAENWMIIN